VELTGGVGKVFFGGGGGSGFPGLMVFGTGSTGGYVGGILCISITLWRLT